jgi:hypothetical protein
MAHQSMSLPPREPAAELNRYPAGVHIGNAMNAKRKAVIERIKSLEDAIGKAREYLDDGKHAHWPGFGPLFARKMRDGKELPPHKDWVKNVFLPRMEKALSQAEKILERFDKAASSDAG